MSGIKFVAPVSGALIDVWAISESEVGCLPESGPIMIQRQGDIPGVPGNWSEAREIFLDELHAAFEDLIESDIVANAAYELALSDVPSVAPMRGYAYVIPGTVRVLSVTPETVYVEDYLAGE